jgi:hypothetical protein
MKKTVSKSKRRVVVKQQVEECEPYDYRQDLTKKSEKKIILYRNQPYEIRIGSLWENYFAVNITDSDNRSAFHWLQKEKGKQPTYKDLIYLIVKTEFVKPKSGWQREK